MKLAPFAALVIAALAATPPAARAMPNLGSAQSASAAPSFLVQIRHHHHHRHHWRYWSRRGEPVEDSAPEEAGSSIAPQPPAAPPSNTAPPSSARKPAIQWVDPDRAGH
jgi:hypothetical protein